MTLTCTAAVFTGCALVPPPATSQRDAVTRARIVNGLGDTTLELPASKTGTGAHDFYSLFATFPSESEAIYGISIATSKKFASVDSQVVADGLGTLKVERRQTQLAGLVNSVNATFTREFLEKAAASGANLKLTSSGKSLEFSVPNWMFAALCQAADKSDWRREYEQKDLAEQLARQQRREDYVKARTDLPQQTKDAILQGTIILGMSSEDARASWGQPERVNRTVGSFGVHEQWIYGNTYLYFDDGVLRSWQDSRRN